VAALRELALDTDAITKYEEKHPEKKRKKPVGVPGGGFGDTAHGFGGGGRQGPFGGMGNMEAPDGMDKDEWARLMGTMNGDFSYEKDPERRRILEKLSKKGMSFGGGTNMDTEQLRNMEKMLDGLHSGKAGPGAAADATSDGSAGGAGNGDDGSDIEKDEM
jgi:hypothetical protein